MLVIPLHVTLLCALCACGRPAAHRQEPAGPGSTGRPALTGRVLLDGQAVRTFAVIVTPAGIEPHPWSRVYRFRSRDGRFAIARLEARAWDVRIVGHGFAPRRVTAQPIRAGAVHDVGDIAVERGAAIFGRVRDETGMPVADATVTLGDRMPWPDVDELTAIARGFYATTTDEEGRYRIVDLDLAMHARQRAHIVATSVGAISDRIPVPDRSATLDLVVEPAGGIAGVIDGSVAPGAIVHARSLTQAGQVSTLVDREGAFRFDHLLPDTYELQLATPPGTASPPLERVVVTASHHTPATIRAPLDPITLTFEVRGPCARVELKPATRGSLWMMTTLAEQRCTGGSASISDVPPGRYRACVDVTRCKFIEVAPSPSEQHVDLTPRE